MMPERMDHPSCPMANIHLIFADTFFIFLFLLFSLPYIGFFRRETLL